MRNYFLATAAAMAIASWAYAEDPKTINVGVLAPLSGPRAEAGRYIKNALLLCHKELERRETKYKINFIFEDTLYNAHKAVNCFQSLKALHKVDFVIGAGGSSQTLAVAPLAERTDTILITPASQSHLITYAGDNIFRLIHNTAQEAPFFCTFCCKSHER